MSKRSRLTRLLVGGLLAGGLFFTQAAPAQADCVSVTFYITREDQAPYYVWDGCVYPTDWTTTTAPFVGNSAEGVVPTGTPNGFFVQVFVPAP